jgi:hypothetical protein
MAGKMGNAPDHFNPFHKPERDAANSITMTNYDEDYESPVVIVTRNCNPVPVHGINARSGKSGARLGEPILPPQVCSTESRPATSEKREKAAHVPHFGLAAMIASVSLGSTPRALTLRGLPRKSERNACCFAPATLNSSFRALRSSWAW